MFCYTEQTVGTVLYSCTKGDKSDVIAWLNPLPPQKVQIEMSTSSLQVSSVTLTSITLTTGKGEDQKTKVEENNGKH